MSKSKSTIPLISTNTGERSFLCGFIARSLLLVRIERHERAVDITIKDNGKGFDMEKTRANGGGFGLLGIAERARILDGEFHVHSTAGQGTIISIKLPTN